MFILQNIIFDCLRPIYNFLRALGVLPVSRRNDSSEFQFHVQSAAMAYSLLIFVVLIVNTAFRFPLTTLSCLMSKIRLQIYSSYILMDRIAIVRTLEGRFEEAVIAYLFIVNLLPIIIVPLMWYECRKIAAILNSWADFEVWVININ